MIVKDILIKNISVVENSRVSMRAEHLQELMDSIKQHGLEQPIGIHPNGRGDSRLMYGHRRLEACRKLGWKTIPAVVHEAVDIDELIVLNMVENLQRKDVTPVELGRLCSKLIGSGMTVSEIASRLSVPVSKVDTAISMFHLIPKPLRGKVKFMEKGVGRGKGNLPASVANIIVGIKKRTGLSDKQFEDLLEAARKEEMSVSDIEIVSRLVTMGMNAKSAIKNAKNYDTDRVDIITLHGQVAKLAKKAGVSKLKYIRGVCYGEYPPLTRPELSNL